jgi:hypothetical protein
VPVLTGATLIEDEADAWNWLRNPLPARSENILFDHIRSDLGLRAHDFYTQHPATDLDDFTRAELRDALHSREDGLTFLQRHNPVLRHTVLRKRETLEGMGLLERIAVDIWPGENDPLFEDQALPTTAEFDNAYEAATEFAKALGKRTNASGFMKCLMQQRICSSMASGIATAKRLLERRQPIVVEGEDDLTPPSALDHFPDVVETERRCLERIISELSIRSTDPKLEAVRYFLQDRGWLKLGCIVFSQYYDTAQWVAQSLTSTLPEEQIALYAGAGKSGMFFNGEWRSLERDDIKNAVRARKLRLVIATDAACEGLNLQMLGALINVDLPWNPSRLEQRIGRIKRIGQTRDRVDMLNLVYANTNDEVVYRALSERMKNRYDLFGSLPDTIETEWIDDIEHLKEYLSQFTNKRKQANAFELRYAKTVIPEGPGWELCEKVLARRDVVEKMSEGW